MSGRAPDEPGPLTAKVLDFERTMKDLVPAVKGPADWAPLAEYVATDEFERVGTFLETQDWSGYTEMLTGWASATSRFETTVRRTCEQGRLVYFEIEERHFRAETVNVVRSLTVFEFDEAGKIRHLDVFLQQPR